MNAMSQWLNNLDPELRRLLAVPPHPWVLQVAKENIDFEGAMLSLGAFVACDLESLTEAFKKFAASRPWPWRDAVTYCKTYFIEHGKFPFDAEEWPDVIDY
jgi:hypothetical protein